jgi:hypothetical protein
MDADRQITSGVIGFISILCNLPLLVVVCTNLHPCRIDALLANCLVVLGIGIVLALCAAWVGSKRWAWAAALPFVTVLACAVIWLRYGNFGPCW